MGKVLALSQRLDTVATQMPHLEAVCVHIARYMNALAQTHHMKQAIELLETVEATVVAAPNTERYIERLEQLHAEQNRALALKQSARHDLEQYVE